MTDILLVSTISFGIFVAMKTCSKCHQNKPDSEFYSSIKNTCKDCHRARQMIWDNAHRQEKIQYNREWTNRNSERKHTMITAHLTVLYATRTGKLIRPTVCPLCNQTAYCEASHTDYSQPLNVTWKCRKCHRRQDAKLPKTRVP